MTGQPNVSLGNPRQLPRVHPLAEAAVRLRHQDGPCEAVLVAIEHIPPKARHRPRPRRRRFR